MVFLDVSHDHLLLLRIKGYTTVSHIFEFRNAPIGAVVLVVVIIFLDLGNSNTENAALPLKTKLKYVDGVGTVAFIGAITCLLLALQWGGQSLPWSSSKIIGLFVGFGCLGIIFIVMQWKRGEYATIPLRVIRQRTVAMIICLLFFVGLTITVVRRLHMHI